MIRLHWALVGLLISLACDSTRQVAEESPNEDPVSPDRMGQLNPEHQDIIPELGLIPVEEYIQSGDSRRFTLSLSEGWLAQIEVQQCGVDVILRWLGPEGEVIEADRPNGKHDREWLTLAAETDLDGIVEVVAGNGSSGYFSASISTYRRIQPDDFSVIEMERNALDVFMGRSQAGPMDWQALAESFASRGDATTAALLHLVRGRALAVQQQFPQALKAYDEAAAVKGVHPFITGSAYNNAGVIYLDRLFQYKEALDPFYRALVLNRETGDQEVEARVLSHLGMAFLNYGELQVAIDYLERAYRVGGQSGVGDNLINNLGVAYKRLGMPERSHELFQKALARARSLGDQGGEAMMLMNLGISYEQAGQDDSALTSLQNALAVAQQQQAPLTRAIVLQALGNFHLQRNRIPQALAFSQDALSLGANSGDIEPYFYFHLARAQFAAFLQSKTQGEPTRDFLDQSHQNLKTARDGGAYFLDRTLEAEASLALAEVFMETEDQQHQAIPSLERAIDLLEGMRGKVFNEDLRTAFFASNQSYYDLFIRLLLEKHGNQPDAGHADHALHVLERATARHLMEVITSAGDPLREEDGSEVAALFEAYYENKHQAEDLRAQLDTGSSRQARAAEARSEALYQQLKDSSHGLVAPAGARILEADAIRGQIDQGTMILAYHSEEEITRLFAIERHRTRIFELPGMKQLTGYIREARQFWQPDGGKDQEQIQALSQALLDPVLPLEGIQRLAIMAAGQLQLVPFSALPVGDGKTLLDQAEVVYLPSVSVLAAMREEIKDRPRAEHLLLVFADPVFEDPNDPWSQRRANQRSTGAEERAPGRLPFARIEANRILKLAASARPGETSNALMDFQATRERAMGEEAQDYRVIHFATHGILNPHNPANSSLLLSLYDQEGRSINGHLNLRDITHLQLKADMAVLSGCRTAMGKEVRGEGLISLARGFMFAGVPRVVATLWQVDDDSTAVFMEAFYRSLLVDGRTAASALRQARLHAKNDLGFTPYQWAGFVLIGDWR